MTSAEQDREFIANVISDYLLEESIEWISSNMEPEDVFPVKRLEEWAETNGFVIEE